MPPPPETVEVDFISPRHLAGGGDPAWVTVPLHRACGWSHGNDPLMPRVLLSSPDQKALLRLEPVPDGQWWTLSHAPRPGRPGWYASFGGHTPVELIAAFTDALTDPTPADLPADPYDPLADADWGPVYGKRGIVSPDSTARVEHVVGRSTDHWVATSAVGDRPVWQARFGEHTPARLITAFTTALADTRPVARTDSPHGLPSLNPGLVTRRSTGARGARRLCSRRTRPIPGRPPRRSGSGTSTSATGAVHKRPQSLNPPSPPGST